MKFWRRRSQDEQDTEAKSGEVSAENTVESDEMIGDADMAEAADAADVSDTAGPDGTDEAFDASDRDETAESVDTPDTDDVEKEGFFRRLFKGLSKTRASIANSFNSVFSFSKIDEDFYEELEETLIMSDMGVKTTYKILDELREKVKEERLKEPAQCRQIVIDIIRDQMSLDEDTYAFEDKKSVILLIGVNGTGKTTSVGKLAYNYKKAGKRVIMAAADTFRAAAGQQLQTWAGRAGVDIIGGQEGADPGSVVFDAVAAAKARKADMLLVDTAGRLHNKKNLMNELGKIYKIIDREYQDAHIETFIVVDGTTGQNALIQAKEFGEMAPITGIILTKLDGTAKGGIAVAIQSELEIPVKFIGVGEGIEDLQRFDPDQFVNALFDEQGIQDTEI